MSVNLVRIYDRRFQNVCDLVCMLCYAFVIQGGRGKTRYHRDRPTSESVTNLTPQSEPFLKYRQLLDSRNDKYERLVKISRDLTIDSKRTIFHLHRYVR